jgi:predicted O-linked N-acetylglucosamine transferase (SPINDLY family)
MIEPPEVVFNRGLSLLGAGRADEALACFDQILVRYPSVVEVLSARSIALANLGRHGEALTTCDQAIAMRPDYVDAHYNRALMLQQLGRVEEALQACDRVITHAPMHLHALTNRSALLSALGKYQEAMTSADMALALKPDHAEALNNRGHVLYQLGRHEEALTSYSQALAVRPDFVEASSNLGLALEAVGRTEDALASYDKALAIRPDYVDALMNRGNCLMAMNRYHEAQDSYRKASSLAPQNAKARFAICTAQLPVLYTSDEEIDRQRALFERHLKTLCDDFERGAVPNLIDGFGCHPPYYLAHQGRNDRRLQTIYGSLGCRLVSQRYPSAPMPKPPAPDEPVRVGIVCGFFWRHSVWKIPLKGWMTELDRRRFRLFGYHTWPVADSETKIAIERCERFVQGPLPIEQWRQAILADAPHILIYPEIGMDVDAMVLAAQRLAPVQCTSWGHPQTTGYPTIDFFLSSDLMEPSDADDHYSEKLIRLPNLSYYYEPFDDNVPPLRREDIGLRPDATVFWCGRSLYTYLPEFDQVFPRIAKAVPNSQFAFIEYQKGTYVTGQFRERLDRAFAKLGLQYKEHCLFLRRLSQPEFSAAASLCDIVLDSIGWSGANSTMESLPHSLPVVTMPASMMRGRHAPAILTMIGVTETIAATLDEYVHIAVRLALEQDWRAAIRQKMRDNSHRAYRDLDCIRALEEFMDRVARSA